MPSEHRPSEHRVFFGEFLRNFHTTGAIAPSSRFLGAALARYLTPEGPPRKILEVGPGTGSVTRSILRRMRPDDHLEVVELNDAFVDVLKRNFQTDPLFAAVADRAVVHHDRVQALPQQQQFDVVVSGLPLNNFAADDVRSILESYQQLLKPGGTLSFFEYMFFRPARSALPGRMRQVHQVLHPWLTKYEFRRDWVWMNVPPAWVHHVRFAPAAAEVTSS